MRDIHHHVLVDPNENFKQGDVIYRFFYNFSWQEQKLFLIILGDKNKRLLYYKIVIGYETWNIY